MDNEPLTDEAITPTPAPTEQPSVPSNEDAKNTSSTPLGWATLLLLIEIGVAIVCLRLWEDQLFLPYLIIVVFGIELWALLVWVNHLCKQRISYRQWQRELEVVQGVWEYHSSSHQAFLRGETFFDYWDHNGALSIIQKQKNTTITRDGVSSDGMRISLYVYQADELIFARISDGKLVPIQNASSDQTYYELEDAQNWVVVQEMSTLPGLVQESTTPALSSDKILKDAQKSFKRCNALISKNDSIYKAPHKPELVSLSDLAQELHLPDAVREKLRQN